MKKGLIRMVTLNMVFLVFLSWSVYQLYSLEAEYIGPIEYNIWERLEIENESFDLFVRFSSDDEIFYAGGPISVDVGILPVSFNGSYNCTFEVVFSGSHRASEHGYYIWQTAEVTLWYEEGKRDPPDVFEWVDYANSTEIYYEVAGSYGLRVRMGGYFESEFPPVKIGWASLDDVLNVASWNEYHSILIERQNLRIGALGIAIGFLALGISVIGMSMAAYSLKESVGRVEDVERRLLEEDSDGANEELFPPSRIDISQRKE